LPAAADFSGSVIEADVERLRVIEEDVIRRDAWAAAIVTERSKGIVKDQPPSIGGSSSSEF